MPWHPCWKSNPDENVNSTEYLQAHTLKFPVSSFVSGDYNEVPGRNFCFNTK